MATFQYTVIIQESSPANSGLGQIWIKESTKQAFMFMGQDASGNAIWSLIAEG